MKKILVDIQSGEIAKRITADYDLWGEAEFANGAEFVCADKGKKIALINQDFDLITGFCFDNAQQYSENLAAVEVNGRWGYIDSKGVFTIEPKYKEANDFENGLAQIRDEKTGKYGYINALDELVIGYYDFLGDFSDGLAFAKNKGSKSFKFLDEKGETALRMKCPINAADDAAIEKLNSFALEEFDKSTYGCDLLGLCFKMINDAFYERRSIALSEFHDGLCQFVELTDDGPKIGFYDKSGNIAIPAEFDFASRFYNGISFYSNGNNIFDCKSGILTKDGMKTEIGDFYWDVYFKYDDNVKLFTIRSNKRNGFPNAGGKYGLVDDTGKIVVQPKFDRIYYPSNGMINVDVGYLGGFIDEGGAYVIPAEYDHPRSFSEHGLCVVAKYGEYSRLMEGIIDSSGSIVAPLIFTDIKILSKERFVAQHGNGYKLFDISGTPVSDNVFGRVDAVFNGFALADADELYETEYNPTGRIFRESCGEGRYLYFHECYPGCSEDHMHGFGLMKEDGTILTPEIFEHAGDFSEGLMRVNSVSWLEDYINLDGIPVLVDFTSNCSDFIDGAAYIATHDWIEGSLLHLQRELRQIEETGAPLEEPLTDNVTTFFINKQGDIIHMDLAQQQEFLQKYFANREKSISKRDWPFKEYLLLGPAKT